MSENHLVQEVVETARQLEPDQLADLESLPVLDLPPDAVARMHQLRSRDEDE